MKFRSVFDIIGPIMVGPSSSHTAGAARIGLFTRNLFGYEPKKIIITLYGSFKETYRGHGTDIALIGGLLGYDTFDKRIKSSMITAKKKNIDFKFIESDIEQVHPNTAKIVVEGNGKRLEVIGKSIGGGKMCIFELQGFDIEVSADLHTLFIYYKYSEESKMKLIKFIEDHKDKILKNRFSNAIYEGKNLLVLESLENFSDEFKNKIIEISEVINVDYAKKFIIKTMG